MNVAGIVKFEKSDITYSDTHLLFEEIEKNHRTGYLIIEWNELQFLLFFEDGSATHGFRIIDERLYMCSRLSRILCACTQAYMVFHPTSSAVLQALLDIKFGVDMYGALYTNYTDMCRLFRLLDENIFSGSVKIDLSFTSWVIVMDKGIPYHIIGQKEGEHVKNLLSSILKEITCKEGIIHIYERRKTPKLIVPDVEAVCCWSSSDHLTLQFAYGQLGKEFESLLDKNLTLSAILDRLMVDFIEIADIYTYLSAKGYIVLKK
ncbi:MAG: hypothetical protein HXS47_05340 [Theionarchaea archaeon]|nr:hypothetical protein [Theionarchaea archaeon]